MFGTTSFLAYGDLGYKAAEAYGFGQGGALIIRTGFWGPIYYIIIRNPKKNIGNYLGLTD